MAKRRDSLAHLLALRKSPGYPLDPVASGDEVRETIFQCTAAMAKPDFPVWILELVACVYYSVARQNQEIAEKTFKVADDIVDTLWKEAAGDISAHLARAVGRYTKGRVLPRDDARRKRFMELAEEDVTACLQLEPDNPVMWSLRIEVDTALMRFPGQPDARTRADRIVEYCGRLVRHRPLDLSAMWSLLRAHEQLWNEATDAEAIAHLAAAILMADVLLVSDPTPVSLHGELAWMLRHMLHTRPSADAKYLRCLRKLLDTVGDSPAEDELALQVLDDVEHDLLESAAQTPLEPVTVQVLDQLFGRIALVRCRALLRRGRDASEKLRCALTMYERIVAKYPGVVEVHEDLAAIHRGLGDEEAVEREVKAVRKLRPDRLPLLRRELKAWVRKG